MVYYLKHKETNSTSAFETADNGLMRIYHDLSRSGGLTINEQTDQDGDLQTIEAARGAWNLLLKHGFERDIEGEKEGIEF